MSLGSSIAKSARRLTQLGLLVGSIAAVRAFVLRRNEQRHGIGGMKNDKDTDV